MAVECIKQGKVAEEPSPVVTAEQLSPVVTAEEAYPVAEGTSVIRTETPTLQDCSQENANIIEEPIFENTLPEQNWILPAFAEHCDPQNADPQTAKETILLEQNEERSNFRTINNIKELTVFEEQLKNPLMETKYLKELSLICSDKKTGLNNAYRLVDTVSDRELMTHCSWGGGTKGEPKHCFKAFTNTINLFMKVVHQYDKTFTKPICEDFFKNVMRHSAKRNTAKRVRDSTTKNKTKNRSKTVGELQVDRAGPSNDS